MGKGTFKVNRGLRTVIAFFILWEVAHLLGLLEAFHIPSPFSVSKTFFLLFVEGLHVGELGKVALFKMAKDSLSRVAAGFSLALILGLSMGFWMGWNKMVKGLLENMITSLRPLPPLPGSLSPSFF